MDNGLSQMLFYMYIITFVSILVLVFIILLVLTIYFLKSGQNARAKILWKLALICGVLYFLYIMRVTMKVFETGFM